MTLSPRIPRAPLLLVQERLQARTDEEHKMEEDSENGEFPHSIKLRDNLLSIYHGSTLNERLQILVQIASVP